MIELRYAYKSETAKLLEKIVGGGRSGELQYRFVQPTVDASGALCPGKWSEWLSIPDFYLDQNAT